jgi:hypothetical protein
LLKISMAWPIIRAIRTRDFAGRSRCADGSTYPGCPFEASPAAVTGGASRRDGRSSVEEGRQESDMVGLIVSASLRFLFRPLLSGVDTSGSGAAVTSDATAVVGFCVG